MGWINKIAPQNPWFRITETRKALPNLVSNRCQLWREWNACHEYWWNWVCVWCHLYVFVILLIKEKATALPQKLSLNQKHCSLANCGLRLSHAHLWVKAGQEEGKAADVLVTVLPGGLIKLQSGPSAPPYPVWLSPLPRCGRRREVEDCGRKQTELSTIHSQAPLPPLSLLMPCGKSTFSNRTRYPRSSCAIRACCRLGVSGR